MERINALGNFFKRNYIIIIVLISIFLLAFYLRSAAISSKYLNGDDPYLAYRINDYFKDHLTVPTNDTLRAYPYGWDWLSGREHLIWFYVGGTFAFLFKQLGVVDAALAACHFYPPFFGAIMVLLIFFIAKEIFGNNKLAILAALFLALLPAIIYRTNSAFADKEPIAGFLMMLGVLFFVKSLKKFSLRDSIIAGISFALLGMTWGGISIMMVTFAAFAVLMIAFNQFPKSFVYTYLIMSAITIGLVVGLNIGYIENIAIYVNLLVIFILLLQILEERYKIIGRITHIDFKGMFGTSVLAVVLSLVLLSAFLYQPLGNKIFPYIKDITDPMSSGVIGSTVAENRPSNADELLSQLGVENSFSLGVPQIRVLLIFSAFIFSVLGFAILIWNGFFRKIRLEFVFFLVAWFLVTLILGIGAVRLLFLTGFPVALLAAYGLYSISEKLWSIKISNYSVGKPVAIFLIGMTLGLSFSAAYVFGMAMQPSMDSNWEQALLWVKANSNPKDVMISWWDYGYIIQKIAERPTYVDPGQPTLQNDTTLLDSQVRNQQVAKVFTSTNETQYLSWLKSLNVKYIIQDVAMIGKYSAVSKIASWGDYVDSILIYSYTGSQSISGGTAYTFGPIWLIQRNNQTTPVLVQNSQIINISKICTSNSTITIDPNGLAGCVFPAGNAVAFIGVRCDSEGCKPYDLSNTLFVSMWFRDASDLQHFKLRYNNQEVKIFEVIY